MKARIAALLAVPVMGVAALTLAAAPAHATVYQSFTTFSWTGAPCVQTLAPVIGNYTTLAWNSICPGAGSHQVNETLVQSGQWIGVRISLTGQTHVACTTWLGPQGGLMSVYVSDSADSSLGSGEADCLRQVP